MNKEIAVVDNDDKKSLISVLNKELIVQTKDPAVMKALLATTFKGFKDEKLVKQACLEAMINGYSFQDIVQKKVYAIPFAGGYSLVQSIADVRATAMRSGQVGKDAPIFEEKNGKIVSCSVTVKRLTGGHIGDYTATVYFSEYDKGRDNWKNKPRTMIAKVAEMHALRMAFPEELAKSYIEDEFNDDGNEKSRIEKAKDDSKSLTMGSLVKPKDDKAKKETKKDTAKDESTESNDQEDVPTIEID